MSALILRLLTVLNTEPIGSTFYHIAEILLQNYSDIEHTSIDEMAKLANVSKSTLSKFANELGFDNYIHLKDNSDFIKYRSTKYYNYINNVSDSIQKNGYLEYFNPIEASLNYFKNNIDIDSIQRLANDLKQYKKIGILGLFFSESAAIDFQYKLAFTGKFVYTFQNDLKQKEFIHHADENTLLIIISNSGDSLRYSRLHPGQTMNTLFSQTHARIFAITSADDILNLPYVDDAIIYPETIGMQSHTFLYPALIDLIVSEYHIITK